MEAIIKIIQDIANKLGIPSFVLLVPFTLTTILELLVVNFMLEQNIKSFLCYTPLLTIVLYFIFYYFSIKTKKFKAINLNIGNNKQLLKKSGGITFICFIVSSLIVSLLIDIHNWQEDELLYHTSGNIGIAIAKIDYLQLNDNNISASVFKNLFKTGFLKPLQTTLNFYYNELTMPKIVFLPSELPQSFQASLLNNQAKINYSAWAKAKNYDIVIYGQAQKGSSDQFYLNLSFDVLSDPQTIKIKKDDLNLNYTISNYNNETLVASFDNMNKEIAGIVLYLDGKHQEAQTILNTVAQSLKNEIIDYNDKKAVSEAERKLFTVKREMIEKNLAVVYFYLGNSYLLSGDSPKAEISYQRAKDYFGYDLSAPITINNEESEKEMKSKETIMNNLSVAFAQNKKLNEAKNILLTTGANNGEDPVLSQNLGLMYLSESINNNDTHDNNKANEIFTKVKTKLDQAGKIENKVVMKNMYHNQGVAAYFNTNFAQAKTYFTKELQIITEIKNKKNGNMFETTEKAQSVNLNNIFLKQEMAMPSVNFNEDKMKIDEFSIEDNSLLNICESDKIDQEVQDICLILNRIGERWGRKK